MQKPSYSYDDLPQIKVLPKHWCAHHISTLVVIHPFKVFEAVCLHLNLNACQKVKLLTEQTRVESLAVTSVGIHFTQSVKSL